jgi:hypothetical protein
LADLSAAEKILQDGQHRWVGSEPGKLPGFLYFVKEAVGVNGMLKVSGKSVRMTTQQKKACEEIGLFLRAKYGMSVGEKRRPELEPYYDKIGISLMGGQGTGKTAILAWLVIYMLYCYHNVLIPSTAPGEDQLKSILWPEISRWLTKVDDEGEAFVLPVISNAIKVQAEKIYKEGQNGTQNFMFKKTANPKDDPEAQAKTLYGYHSSAMMIVVCEASHVPEPVFRPLEGTLTDVFNFIVMDFNPVYRTGFAVESQTGAFTHKWVCCQFNAEESEIVTPQHIQDQKEKYGEGSNTYRTLVKGIPPLAEEDTIIPYEWVQAAATRVIDPAPEEPHIGGLDCGGGGDNSVYTHRNGMKVLPQETFSSPNSLEVGQWAARNAFRDDLDALYVDVIGIGNGAYYEAKRLLQGSRTKVYAVDVRNRCTDSRDEDRYPNKRSKLWFKAREFFQENGIAIPNDQTLKEELWSPKRKPNARKDEAEAKEDMKKRLGRGRSPNNADSLLLTFDKPDLLFRKRIYDLGEKEDRDIVIPLRPLTERPRGWMRV